LLNASWKDGLRAAGTCFVHDLDWQTIGSQANNVSINRRTIQPTSDDFAPARELEAKQCLQAAREFELKVQAEAVWATIQSKSNQAVAGLGKMLPQLARSKREFVSVFENSIVGLADMIEVTDSNRPRLVTLESNQCFDSEWNCDTWSRVQPGLLALPARGMANVFVYAINEARHSDESSLCIDRNAVEPENLGSDPCHQSFDSNTYLILESEHASWRSEFDFCSVNPWQIGIDPVSPEIDSSSYAAQWSGAFEQASVCCPMELSADAETREVTSSIAVTTVRPPRLEAEYDSDEKTDLVEVKAQATKPETELAAPLIAFSERFMDDAIHDYSSSWVNSLIRDPFSYRSGRRFTFGDDAPRIPKAVPPVERFSKEDLLDASKRYSDFVGKFSLFPLPISKFAEINQNGSIAKEESFASKDFLTTLQTTSLGSIILPLSQSHRFAMDYAMKIVTSHRTESRSRVSKKIAVQIKTIGQFLVDFGSQIESQVEQIELANRENNRR